MNGGFHIVLDFRTYQAWKDFVDSVQKRDGFDEQKLVQWTEELNKSTAEMNAAVDANTPKEK